MSKNETIEDFRKRHPGEAVEVSTNNFLLPDGASFAGDGSGFRPYFTLREPPLDPIARKRAEIRYMDAIIQHRVALFDRFQTEFSLQDKQHVESRGLVPPAPPQAVQFLRDGKADIEQLAARRAELQQELAALNPPPTSAQALMDAQSARQREATSRQAERAAITL